MKKEFCVISHTHWDREWYLNFEQFRIKLVELIDRLLDILDKDEEYVFHLDAQTIVLEDYLEIKPYQKEKLTAYIKEGRILVGPWYVQNDFYLTSGESTIRNLIIGSRMADYYGCNTPIGYMPDQFGLISQMPQILNGFGITESIFGRGYNFVELRDGVLHPEKKSCELTWEGADGSELFSVLMPYWYNNAQRFSADVAQSTALVNGIESSFEGVAKTPYLLLMNGVDHLEAQEDLMPILEQVNDQLDNGSLVKQTRMDTYLDKVKAYISDQAIDLDRYIGEMRNGHKHNILQGTLSSRVYLKIINTAAQNMLESKLEPIYTMLWMAGAKDKYPWDYILHLWKEMIKNHPHDSICGCSIDDVHNNMEDRYQRIATTADGLLERGLDFLSAHVDRNGYDEDSYIITVYNTHLKACSQVVDMEIEFPVEEEVAGFKMWDDEGKEVPFVIVGKRRRFRDMFTGINLPGVKEVDVYRIEFMSTDVDGLGFKTYNVVADADSPGISDDEQGAGTCVLSNDHLKVEINEDGSIDLTNLWTRETYSNILVLEEMEDCGDAYLHEKSPNNQVITSEGVIPEILSCKQSDYTSSAVLKYAMDYPKAYDFDNDRRMDETILNEIEVTLSLAKDQKWLDVSIKVDNTSRDHRVRALIRTGIDGDLTRASSPFDVITRDRRDVLKGIRDGGQPNAGFVTIEDEEGGIAVFNKGLYDYEHLTGEVGVMAFTLVRGNGRIHIGSPGDQWKAPGNQCLREIETSLAICPYEGDMYEAQIPELSKVYQVPMLTYWQPVKTSKFLGGRAAVQDSLIKETFVRKDEYPSIRLDANNGFLSLVGEGVEVSSVKLSEDKEGIIVRLYNVSDSPATCHLEYFKEIKSLERVSLDETFVELVPTEGKASKPMTIRPKEIMTLLLK